MALEILNCLPPILEVEDRPSSTRGSILDTSPSINEYSLLSYEYESDPGIENEEKEENTKEAPRLGPERPIPKIDDHTQFWSIYDRVAGAYDREFLDAWNKSLDVLLIFAGLFSAINTAFIIESYKGLQPDPMETTNALLRLFISHRNDNITLSIEELNPGSPTPSAMSINSIFFSSLSFSLAAAFGAVTAKQWLTEYINVGAVKAMDVQGRKRQKKYNGLKTWHLRLIIELLPMLLQISLLLFLIGVVDFLWNLDRKVAVIQLVLTGIGLALYFITIVLGIIFPSSPFRTPLTIYLPRYFNKVGRGLITLLGSLMPSHRIESTIVAARKVSWIDAIAVALTKLDITETLKSFCLLAEQELLGLRQRMGYATAAEDTDTSLGDTSHTKWDTEDVISAEAVVWLLEQAEHPDVTITALDAVTRLPPDLILDLIQKREGLLERLVGFHKGLLRPLPDGKVDMGWIKQFPDRAIVSGAALWHILKVKGLVHNDMKGESVVHEYDWNILDERPGDPITTTKFYLTWNHLMFSRRTRNDFHRYITSQDSFELSPSANPFQFVVEFMDARQAPTGISFTTSVSPFFLHLDAIIHFACKVHDTNLPHSSLSSYLDKLSLYLHGDLSSDIVSHVAITVAAGFWRNRHSAVWSYPSAVGQKRFESVLINNFHALDKSKMLLENVVSALSVIDVSFWTSTIFQTLFSIMYPSFMKALEQNHPATAHPNFPQSLLRLSLHDIDDTAVQTQIVEIVGRCTDGDWASPLHKFYGKAIVKLLSSLLHSDTTAHPTAPLLDMIARVSDDTQLLQLLQPGENGLYQFHEAISELIVQDPYPLEQFVSKVLEMDVPPDIQGPLEVQIAFMAVVVSTDIWGRYGRSMGVLFNHMLNDETELHWPAYFISAGIISPDAQAGQVENAAPLKYIAPEKYFSCLEEGLGENFDEYKAYVLLGESIILLWKKARQYHENGNLPYDWSDSIFFEEGTVDNLFRYLKYVQEHKYTGVKWEIYAEYFQSALQMEEDPNQDEFDEDEEPETSRWRARIQKALEHVNAHIQDLPSRWEVGNLNSSSIFAD